MLSPSVQLSPKIWTLKIHITIPATFSVHEPVVTGLWDIKSLAFPQHPSLFFPVHEPAVTGLWDADSMSSSASVPTAEEDAWGSRLGSHAGGLPELLTAEHAGGTLD